LPLIISGRSKRNTVKGRERKTEIRSFDTIEATKVVVANEKLYVNRAEGFAGTSLKKDEYVVTVQILTILLFSGRMAPILSPGLRISFCRQEHHPYCRIQEE
jgi:hypothetical protein